MSNSDPSKRRSASPTGVSSSVDQGTVVDELNVWSKRFAEESTLLSARIDQFQQWIDSLPGKLAVGVANDDGTFHVTLTRSGDAWLVMVDPDVPNHDSKPVNLTRASISVKARAAALLPELAQSLLEEVKSRAIEAGSARVTLDDLFRQLGLTQKRS